MQSIFQEHERLLGMSFHESRLRNRGFQAIAGIDEAGRGPLAGPVVAAACILPSDKLIDRLNDSKQLGAKARDALYETLTSDPTIAYGVGIISAARIDEINILQATFEAMQEAVRQLSKPADYLLVDGNQLPKFTLPSEALIKGDSLSLSIAAASIIAKTIRDRLMCEAAKEWPQYKFEKHKGYGTALHLESLRLHGPCPIHRRSFAPVRVCS